MSERRKQKYAQLLEVWLLHHYWLDKGSTLFDNLSDEEQECYLIDYDITAWIQIEPTKTA